jgi:hypothetical protein
VRAVHEGQPSQLARRKKLLAALSRYAAEIARRPAVMPSMGTTLAQRRSRDAVDYLLRANCTVRILTFSST